VRVPGPFLPSSLLCSSWKASKTEETCFLLRPVFSAEWRRSRSWLRAWCPPSRQWRRQPWDQRLWVRLSWPWTVLPPVGDRSLFLSEPLGFTSPLRDDHRVPGVRFRRLCRKHPEKFGKKAQFSGDFLGFRGLNPFLPVFSCIGTPGGQVLSDGNSLPPGLKLHQEPARCRDHGHHETRPGIGLGRTNRLAEVAENAMHLTGTIADPQQNRWTRGMRCFILNHGAQLPDRRHDCACRSACSILDRAVCELSLLPARE